MNRFFASLATVLVDGAWAAVFARLGELPVERGPSHRDEVRPRPEPLRTRDRERYRD